MSSYQFVNSLASCYANQQGRPATTPDQQHQTASPGGDYYNPNAATASAYPPNCYSPPQVPTGHHYPQHAYATPATATSASHLQPSGMVDYTQLQPQRHPGSSSTHLHHTSPGAQSPGLLAPQNPTASCKYADSTSSTGVASPQDLSTTGPAPTRSTPPLNNNTSAAANVTKATGLTSPLSVSTSPPGKQANASSTVSQNLSSPASSTSSTSSSERTANSNNNSKSQGNPPQIYPWMKRVHLGQSKLFLIIFYI